jgi:hypothetical protein
MVMDVLVEDEGWSGFVSTMIRVGQARGVCFGICNLQRVRIWTSVADVFVKMDFLVNSRFSSRRGTFRHSFIDVDWDKVAEFFFSPSLAGSWTTHQMWLFWKYNNH